ncbi:hypothetical protein [Streptomyces spiramenti]|uniref:LigA protein n=1 Tax=Streptomyces spiramenti TaxID=2720606 RepID=A0ABX1APH4_9ACTN|nr:hypothetical protein [Streptomyces spiramenti]NJP66573.1 hypothetical protein [Streptomyces spiramenti]
MTATDHPDQARGGGWDPPAVTAGLGAAPRNAGPEEATEAPDSEAPRGEEDHHRHYYFYAQGGNINTGAMYGDQRVTNGSGEPVAEERRTETREGPISSREVIDAVNGFAEHLWFPNALTALDQRVLFLVGARGSGRRTAALNLLHRHSGLSFELRALDGDTDLAEWQPKDSTRGYLVHGTVLLTGLRRGTLAGLRRRLAEANARMVIVLDDEPALVRPLRRDLDVTPFTCVPPPPRAVFDARLRAVVPVPADRERLLASLGAELLDELLAPQLTPAQVSELVHAINDNGDAGPDAEALRDQLSFLARDEVTELLESVREHPDELAFLLAAAVFEGQDHRIVREEADRLLGLADGRLHHLLPTPGPCEDGAAGPAAGHRPNPGFALRRSLDDLLRATATSCGEPEIRRGNGFTYLVEPVRFTRHQQAESLLRHVWRQYSQVAELLADWLGKVPDDPGLAEPVGRAMGRAIVWSGARRSLDHVKGLAGSDTESTRRIAAFALDMAAASPVNASEVKFRLHRWSWIGGWQLRSTVALTCGTPFGVNRPDMAVKMLRGCHRGAQGNERHVAEAVRWSLDTIFASGAEEIVMSLFLEWQAEGGRDAGTAADLFPGLLGRRRWFRDQLASGGSFMEPIVDLVHVALARDATFEATAWHLIRWCMEATWEQQLRVAVETLLAALSLRLDRGVLRLFRRIDHDTGDIAGRHIARAALDRWRNPEQHAGPTYRPRPHGGAHEH